MGTYKYKFNYNYVKKLFFYMPLVILTICIILFTYINEASAITEDNWLNREVARQVFNDESRYGELTEIHYATIKSIDLNSVNINSTIPKSIGKLTNLKQLLLTGCNLYGSVPEEIGNLNNLVFLDLSNNNLSGELPVRQLETLPLTCYETEKSKVSFANNQFIGKLSNELKLLLRFSDIFEDNLLENEPDQKQLVSKSATVEITKGYKLTQNELKNVVDIIDNGGNTESVLYELEFLPDDDSFFDDEGVAIKSGVVAGKIKIKDENLTNFSTQTNIIYNISPMIGNNSEINVNFNVVDSLEVYMGSDIFFGEVSSGNEEEVLSSTITVTSTFPYNISVKANSNFIGKSNLNNSIPISKLSLDIDNLGYNNLSLSEIVYINNALPSVDKVHNLNFKLTNTLGYVKDIYNTHLYFIVSS